MFGCSQRRAVSGRRACLGWGGPAYDRADPDQGRSLCLLGGGDDRSLESVEIVGVRDNAGVPSVRLKAEIDVLAREGEFRRSIDGDAVVVVEVDDAPEAEMAGQRRRLGGHALHEIAVGADPVNLVV